MIAHQSVADILRDHWTQAGLVLRTSHWVLTFVRRELTRLLQPSDEPGFVERFVPWMSR